MITKHQQLRAHLDPPPLLLRRGVGEEDHVDIICQLRHGGEDEHHCGQHHHAHRGESVNLYRKNIKEGINYQNLILNVSENERLMRGDR